MSKASSQTTAQTGTLLPPEAVEKIGARLARGVFTGRRGHGNAPASEIHLKQDELAALLGAAYEGGFAAAHERSGPAVGQGSATAPAAALDAAARLRALAQGRWEWRVADPVTGAYCMEFMDHEERRARAWLSDHQARFPNGPHAGKVVQRVLVTTPLEDAALAAADALDDAAAAARIQEEALTLPATERPISVASRASMGLRPAKWRELRDEGWPILSTWINEAGAGETEDFGELWTRIVQEVRQACGVILWAEKEDFPLKGAFVEAGIALGMGKRVAVCTQIELLAPQFAPFGSWLSHPSVRVCADFGAARRWVQEGVEPASAGQLPTPLTAAAALGA